MDLDRYSIRPFDVADYDDEARLAELNDPGTSRSAQEIRHWRETELAEPGHISRKFVVVDRGAGQVVAFGDLAHRSFNYHPRKFWLVVVVDPAHPGRGIGTELFTMLEDEARGRDAICL